MEKTKSIFDRVYTLLVDEAKADEGQRFAFVLYHSNKHNPLSNEAWQVTEWRFMGVLGAGGKFWVNLDEFHVTCYSEDRTENRGKLITRLNSLLKPLYDEFFKYSEEKQQPEGAAKAGEGKG